MKVIVIAPHMDDEVLGVGGTILKHVDNGDEVYCCFVAHRIYNHNFDKIANDIEKKCALEAKEIMGYKDARFLNLNDERLDLCIQDILVPLENYISEIDPEVVYVNHGGDNHQDHKAVYQAAMVAIRPSASLNVKKVFVYETPSSTEQSPNTTELAFLPNYYVNIESYLDKKIEAISCYEREERNFPHPRSLEAIKTLARSRGIQIGFIAAEAFMVLRAKWQ